MPGRRMHLTLCRGGNNMAVERRIVVFAFLCVLSFQSPAQPYPAKPIRVIVGVPPGSGVELVMRAAGQDLAPRLGQPFVVENRPGGNAIIAAQACARAVPDGYTVCYVSADSMSFNPHVFASLPYD